MKGIFYSGKDQTMHVSSGKVNESDASPIQAWDEVPWSPTGQRNPDVSLLEEVDTPKVGTAINL